MAGTAMTDTQIDILTTAAGMVAVLFLWLAAAKGWI